MIGGFFVGASFIVITAIIYNWIFTNTDVFSDSVIMNIVRQILIGALFILFISILANYQVLKIVKNHAFTLLKMAIFLQIVIFAGGFVAIGLLIGEAIGIAIAGIGGVIFLIFMYFWPRIRIRLEIAAEWLSIAANIVLAEPGMIFLSIVQSFVIGITVITEIITIFSFNLYANSAAIDSNLVGYIQYIIGFVYLTFSLFVLYYFDGANTIMAYSRIKGKDPTIKQGIGGATKMIFAIFGFALLTAIVKTIAQALRSAARDMRQSNKGSIHVQILAGVFGFMIGIAEWIYHMLSFFTLPIIVLRGKGTKDAMSESKDLFSRNAWNVILSDMGFGFGSTIMYFITGIFLAVGGYFYGYIISTSAGWIFPVLIGIIVAILAMIFGLSITKFFLRPLYTSFVTAIYVYASEGPNGLKIVSEKLINRIDESLQHPRARPRHMR